MTNTFRFLGTFCLIILLAGCSGCGEMKVKKEKLKDNEKNETKRPESFDKKVPDACSLITTEEIAAIINVKAADISIKDASNLKSRTTRSCFFRWEHQGVPNSGVLIQAQSNPLPEDFPEYITTYINSKKESGEKSMDGDTFVYKPFNGGGVEGAYNHDQSKYLWRVNDEIIYTITFNLGADEATQLGWAEKIASYVNN